MTENLKMSIKRVGHILPNSYFKYAWSFVDLLVKSKR